MTCAEEVELEREEDRNDEEKIFSVLTNSIVQDKIDRCRRHFNIGEG